MIGLLQRVSEAHVDVGGKTIGAIGAGLMVLVCAERDDTATEAERLLERLLDYRVFADAAGKMNLSLRDVAGGLLLVPQFTLAADTGKGTRPSFSPAAPPDVGSQLFKQSDVRPSRTFPGSGGRVRRHDESVSDKRRPGHAVDAGAPAIRPPRKGCAHGMKKRPGQDACILGDTAVALAPVRQYRTR